MKAMKVQVLCPVCQSDRIETIIHEQILTYYCLVCQQEFSEQSVREGCGSRQTLTRSHCDK